MCKYDVYLACCLVLLLSTVQPGSGHVNRGTELSEEQHYSASGEHNTKFDHEAFLGKELAEKLKAESFDSNKKRLVEIIAKIDADKNGTISEPEMYEWIKSVALKSQKKDARGRWDDVNPQKKEKLSFDDYLVGAFGPEDRMPKDGQFWLDYERMKKNDMRRWSQADTDKDDLISFEEFLAFIHPEDYPFMKNIVTEETLDSMDADQDGSVSLEEYLLDLSKALGKNDYDPKQMLPEWAVKEAENFRRWRDKDHDGKMSREEVTAWVMPEDYDAYDAEAKHLFYHADSDKDKQLTVEEILENQDTFIGSQATNYGKMHSEL